MTDSSTEGEIPRHRLGPRVSDPVQIEDDWSTSEQETMKRWKLSKLQASQHAEEAMSAEKGMTRMDIERNRRIAEKQDYDFRTYMNKMEKVYEERKKSRQEVSKMVFQGYQRGFNPEHWDDEDRRFPWQRSDGINIKFTPVNIICFALFCGMSEN
eukprot:768473-Hanusia_phi.AAC.22